MLDMLRMFLSKSWEFFQIQWPGFNFSIGDVFLAAAVSVGAFTAILKMIGVSTPSLGPVVSRIAGFAKDDAPRGGNNSRIRISENRKGDTK